MDYACIFSIARLTRGAERGGRGTTLRRAVPDSEQQEAGYAGHCKVDEFLKIWGHHTEPLSDESAPFYFQLPKGREVGGSATQGPATPPLARMMNA